jgi:hypothetical protein
MFEVWTVSVRGAGPGGRQVTVFSSCAWPLPASTGLLTSNRRILFV